MEIYKWKWMMLRAYGCMNNVDFEKNNIEQNMLIICQKLRHLQVINEISTLFEQCYIKGQDQK